MTNPHQDAPTDIDIRESSQRVIALLEQQRVREAMQLLEQERLGERAAVQEALDRYVARGAADQIGALRATGAVLPIDDVTLERLALATHAPRLPVHEHGQDDPPNELSGLTEEQRHDIYASIVHARGNRTAHGALERPEERVILGLRNEDTTFVSRNGGSSGTGIYNDRVIVLWSDHRGGRHLHEVLRANTEPTAQYDHHAGSNGRRRFAEGGVDEQQREASRGYEQVVRPRKIEGSDIDGDGIRDLGRLADGTIEMFMDSHALPGGGGSREPALRPTGDAVAQGHGLVQRDSNADGYFNQTDVNGVQDLNNSFKVHRGSSNNTDSAGCQTLHYDDYPAFLTAVQGNPNQTNWQYVLTNTTPGLFRDVQINVDQAPSAERLNAQPEDQRAPAAPRMGAPDGRGRPEREQEADAPQRDAQRDRQAQYFPASHHDYALFEAIRRQLPEGTPDERTAHVVLQARIGGVERADQLNKVVVQGETAFVVGNTPGFRATVDLATAPPLQETLRQSESFDRQQAQQLAQDREQQTQINARSQSSPVRAV